MKKQSEKFNIDQYIKIGFDLIVELDDGVEYLLDKEAVASIRNNEMTVILKRLIDSEKQIIVVDRVIKSLNKNGPIDYIKSK